MKRPALLLPALLCALLLAACGPKESAAPDAAAEAGPAASAPADGNPSAEAQAAAASAAAAAGATVASDAAPATEADAATDPATPTVDPVDLVEGRDYVLVHNAQPWEPLNGKVEVVEVFGYVCPACFRLQPIFASWKAQLPADVRVSYVPAPFGAQWTPYAKAFYVADSLGLVEATQTPMFNAIHVEDALPGEGETPDEDAIAQWYGKHGADPRQFRAAMDSFATTAKVNRGRQFMVRTGVAGTPTIVVNGKYRVTGGRTYQEVLAITDKLIRKARAEAGAAAP